MQSNLYSSHLLAIKLILNQAYSLIFMIRSTLSIKKYQLRNFYDYDQAIKDSLAISTTLTKRSYPLKRTNNCPTNSFSEVEAKRLRFIIAFINKEKNNIKKKLNFSYFYLDIIDNFIK